MKHFQFYKIKGKLLFHLAFKNCVCIFDKVMNSLELNSDTLLPNNRI